MFNDKNAAIDEIKTALASHRPLAPQEVAQVKEYFRIGLTYTSNALEGNSLTETETKVILEDGLAIGGKSMREHLEVLGHSKAFDAMYKLASNTTITEQDILTLHALFYSGIDYENAGRYRKVRIMISGVDHAFPVPEAVPDLMRTFVDQITVERNHMHPVTFAAWLHERFVNIHPFIDGNGRTARLLMNLALLQQGYVVTIIPVLMRTHYLAALRKTNTGDAAPFYNFMSEMAYESHKEYKRLLGL